MGVGAVIAIGAGIGAMMEKYGVGINYRDVNSVVLGNDEQIDTHALGLATQSLKLHEGNRNDVYKDSRGILTVGIGHKVLPTDNLKLGDRITDERKMEFFAKDLAGAFKAAKAQAKELNKYNAQMIAGLIEVNFQLGVYWKSKFPNTWSLLASGNWQQATSNLLKSEWYKQTPVRVTAFISVIRSQYA